MIKLSGFWMEDALVIMGALASFIGLVTVLRRHFMRFIFGDILKKLDDITEEQKKTRKDVLTLKMHCETICLKERIQAGHNYLNLGGNGGEQVYYERLKKQYEMEINGEGYGQ